MSVPARHEPTRPMTALLPIMAAVFVGYLVIGIPLPVLPLYVHDDLRMSTVMVGFVAGAQSGAALVTRMWAGHLTDVKGGRYALITGLLAAASSGALYIVSMQFEARPVTSVTVLLIGRGLLGAAESMLITGALTWGLALLGSRQTGAVMSWIGTALYAALAVGAPIGTLLYAAHGFGAVAIISTALPLAAVGLVLPVSAPAHVAAQQRPPFAGVIGLVWKPGLALALSGVGFGAVTTFTALLLAVRHWQPIWLAFTALSVAFIVGRLSFGRLPDRLGGARVACVCMGVEAAGLLLVWLAGTAGTAFAAIALIGLGYSLVYPGLGVEALRDARPENRGVAMGTYTAFLDLSLGVTAPVLGLVAQWTSLADVFLVSAVVVAGAAVLALRLARG